MLKVVLTSLVLLVPIAALPQASEDSWLKDEFGAIIRGDATRKNVALIFSGDEFGDGTDTVLYFLTKHNVPASFFLSKKFYTNENHDSFVEHIITKGHYVGLHPENTSSYVAPSDRSRTVISETEFKKDLHQNYQHLAPFGIKKHDVLFFLPSHDGYNQKIVTWSEHLGYPVISQTPGTLLSYDTSYPEQGDGYKSADDIYTSIVEFEKRHPHGLNGFLIVTHLGTDSRRKDKFYNHLGRLIEHLDRKGYNFVEINELLE